MKKTNFLVLISILILITGNVYLGLQCFLYKSDLDRLQKDIAIQQINGKGIFFTKFLVSKVLQGEGEISFEDRLKLENAVRDLNDPEIFAQWQKFTNSKTNQETQQSIGTLFDMLLNKISY